MRHIKRSLSDIPENGTEKIRYGGWGLDLFYMIQMCLSTVISTILYIKKWVERDLIALVEAYEKHPLVQKAQKDMQKLLDRKKQVER